MRGKGLTRVIQTANGPLALGQANHALCLKVHSMLISIYRYCN
jgi:hypothetical protein